MQGRVYVLTGGLCGFVVIAVWFAYVPDLIAVGHIAETLDRLVLGVRWAALLQVPLALGIVAVAQQRFWSSRYADGSAPISGSSLDINRRYLTNTVEQTLLATVGTLALAVTAPPDYLSFVPALAMLFVLARICFWVGYLIHPYARAFGLVLTLAPTIAVYIYVLTDLANSLGA